LARCPKLNATRQEAQGRAQLLRRQPRQHPSPHREWLRSAAGIDVTLLHYASAPQGDHRCARAGPCDDRRGHLDARRDRLRETQAACGHATRSASPSPLTCRRGRDFPIFEAVGWLALMAPPGTPLRFERRIATTFARWLAEPRLQNRYEELGTHIRRPRPRN
jgi:hypothetical protein